MTFAHLHTHSEFSALDGLSTCREIAARAAADGNPYAAVTDHGNCAAHPEFQRACDESGIKPVFGMEAYFIPDRIERPGTGDTGAQKRLRANRHLILLARGQQGLRDLWAMSTESYVSGVYYKPRIDWQLLDQYGSDLIATTACLGGIMAKEVCEGRFDEASRRLDRLRALFPGRLYLELQANDIPLQMQMNQRLVRISELTGVPLVAAADSHFPSYEQEQLHKTWLACQTSSANEDYWHFDPMHTEDEIRQRLIRQGLDAQVVDEAVRNTMEIAEQCTARIGATIVPPVFTASAADDARMLYEKSSVRLAALLDAGTLRGGNTVQYWNRLDDEFSLVSRKSLAGCYLVVDDICSWARSEGILVGPGRGSAAGSLMSYLLGITIADPLETGLMFGRFLTPGRTALPDFDMDFPSSQREKIQTRVIERYGPANVVRVGTHLRYRGKGILNKLFSLADREDEEALENSRTIAGIIDEAESHTAGLGLPWPDLMIQCETELAPFLERHPFIFSTAALLVGRLHAYGRHPAGLVISTGAPLEGALPMRTPAPGDPTLVSQWDFRDMEAQGLLKLDFLTLRTLDSIQEALTLIQRRTGVRPDPASWRTEYEDPQVWDDISSGHTLGMFQVETSLGRRAAKDMGPRSVAELADLITLVRPGPRNSGMAASYLRRRAGVEDVTYPHEALGEFLRGRQGVMLYQEDILYACTVLAGYDGAEADAVRKVLGKKLTEKIADAGVQFASRCESHGVASRSEAEDIWSVMAEFGKYAFNLSHAYSYALLAYWTAWLKTHYPVETITGICSTLDDKDRTSIFVTEARRLGITVLPPDINAHTRGFAREGISIRYGLDAIKGIGPQALRAIERGQPYMSYADFAAHGLRADVIYALARSGALDSLVYSRKGLIDSLDDDRSGDSIRCVHKDDSAHGPNGLPCVFDWASEPIIERTGARGQPLKPLIKLPPKKCTRACRHYTPPEIRGIDSATLYAAEELWRMEHEIFGVWLTPAPFARLDEITPGGRQLAREAAALWPSLPPGDHLLPGVISSRRRTYTRGGRPMMWLSVATESSYIDIAVFSPRDDDEPDLLTALRFIEEGSLCLITAKKSRYQAKDGTWRNSAHLRAIRRL